jgi:hypothetical protein
MSAEHKICIDVPEHIAKWIAYLATEGVDVAPFIREFIHRLYDIWVMGAREGEKGIGAIILAEPGRTIDMGISDKILRTIRKCIEAKICNQDRAIYRRFALWLQGAGIDICRVTEDHIREFANLYQTMRGVTDKSLKIVVWRIKRFLTFAQEDLCRGESK